MKQLTEIRKEYREQARKELALQRANYLVQNKRVRRSPCSESRNIWMVGSYSQPKKLWYVVRYHDDINAFSCGCKSFTYSHDNCCLHVLAVAIFEGRGPL